LLRLGDNELVFARSNRMRQNFNGLKCHPRKRSTPLHGTSW
jgi:hypothetical protein